MRGGRGTGTSEPSKEQESKEPCGRRPHSSPPELTERCVGHSTGHRSAWGGEVHEGESRYAKGGVLVGEGE